jgi:hypothetical protein
MLRRDLQSAGKLQARTLCGDRRPKRRFTVEELYDGVVSLQYHGLRLEMKHIHWSILEKSCYKWHLLFFSLQNTTVVFLHVQPQSDPLWRSVALQGRISNIQSLKINLRFGASYNLMKFGNGVLLFILTQTKRRGHYVKVEIADGITVVDTLLLSVL